MRWYKQAKPMAAPADPEMNEEEMGDEPQLQPDLSEKPLTPQQVAVNDMNALRGIGVSGKDLATLQPLTQRPQDAMTLNKMIGVLPKVNPNQMESWLKQNPPPQVAPKPKVQGPGTMKPHETVHPANDPNKKPSPVYDKSQQQQKKNPRQMMAAWVGSACKFAMKTRS